MSCEEVHIKLKKFTVIIEECNVIQTLTGAETDPIFSIHVSSTITQEDIDRWNSVTASEDFSVLRVKVATTAVFPGSPILTDNGGIGDILTRTGNGTLGTIDGVTQGSLNLDDRILQKTYAGANRTKNGIWKILDKGLAGAAGRPYQVVRTADSDETSELHGQVVSPNAGTQRGRLYSQTTLNPILNNPVTGLITYIDTTPNAVGIVSILYANLLALCNTGRVVTGTFYRITDRANFGIILQGTSSTRVSLVGKAGYSVPNYAVAIDWYSGNEGAYANGVKVVWNGATFTVTDDTQFTGDTPDVNVLAYTPSSDYVQEWDNVEYDFFHDWINSRTDKRNNRIGGSWNYEQRVANGFNVTTKFKWGSQDCHSNYVNEGLFDCLNVHSTEPIWDNKVYCGGALKVVDGSCIVKHNRIYKVVDITTPQGGAAEFSGNDINAATTNQTLSGTMKDNIINSIAAQAFTGATSVNGNKIYQSAAATVISGIFNRNKLYGDTIVSSSTAITDTTFTGSQGFCVVAAGGCNLISCNVTNSNLSLSSGTIQGSEFRKAIINGVFNNIAITDCYFGANVSATFADNLNLQFCIIDNGGAEAITFDSEFHQRRRLITGFSDFQKTYDISTLTTLTMDATFDKHIGIAILNTSGAAETLDKIQNLPLNHPVKYIPFNAKTITFQATAIITPPVADDIVLEGDANVIVVGRATVSDYLILASENSINRYVAKSKI